MRLQNCATLPVLLLPLLAVSAAGQQPQARIRIDTNRVIGEVNPHIFGNFAEHLGRCIYGGIFEEGSPLSDAEGYRKDVLEAVKPLGVSILRWPGGNFASGYNWMDGVGPRDQRPARPDHAWGALESNRFGTDEFLRYCERVGSEPYLCINAGLGSVDSARQWVEYCNETRPSYWANQRRKNGREKPWNVKIWGLGNEIDGPWQLGHKSAEDYAKFALQAAVAMRRQDDSIQLIASGSSNFRPNADWIGWNRTVLSHLKDEINYISLHTYIGNPDSNFEKYLSVSQDLDDRIGIVEGQIRAARNEQSKPHPIYIAFDEWNTWYRARSGTTEFEIAKTGLEEHYNFEDALATGMFLNSFIRHANIVKMANLAQLVNVIAPIFTSKQGMFLQTIYFPLDGIRQTARESIAGRAGDEPDIQSWQPGAAGVSGCFLDLQCGGSRGLCQRSESQREAGYRGTRGQRGRADRQGSGGLGNESGGPESDERFRQREGASCGADGGAVDFGERVHVFISEAFADDSEIASAVDQSRYSTPRSFSLARRPYRSRPFSPARRRARVSSSLARR